DPNRAPTVTNPVPQSNAEANIIALTIAATDPDNDALTYSATGLPTGLSIETGTGKITGTIDYAASTGSPYNVTVTVKDPSNASASASFVWTVSNTNRETGRAHV